MAARFQKIVVVSLAIVSTVAAFLVILGHLTPLLFIQIELPSSRCGNMKILPCRIHGSVQSTAKQQHTSDKSQAFTRSSFAYRHFEQLSMAATYLKSLARLAALLHGQAIIPYVHHLSKPGQGIDPNRKLHDPRHLNPSIYFNISGVNQVLKRHRWTSLASHDYLPRRCNKTLDVLIHFMFQDSTANNDAKKLDKMNNIILQQIKDRLAENRNGWTFCPFIAYANLGPQLSKINIKRYICVNPTKFQAVKRFSKQVLRNATCVGVLLHHGKD